MNYAWEAVLLAEQNDRDRDSLRFVEAVTPSPYIEVSVTDLNTGEPEGDRVEINPLYRLGDVFGRLFDRNTDQMVQTRALFSTCACTTSHSSTCGKGCQRRTTTTACWRTTSVQEGTAGQRRNASHCSHGRSRNGSCGSTCASKDGKLPGVVPESSDGDVRGRVGVRE